MEVKNEEVKEVEASWDEIGLERGKYFSPERDKPYTITISSARLVRDERYKDKEGKPKLKLKVKLSSVNGEPSELEWTTGSWGIIREIKKCVLDKSLGRSVFFLKMKEEQGRRTYVFEKTGEKNSPFSFDEDEIEAYL